MQPNWYQPLPIDGDEPASWSCGALRLTLTAAEASEAADEGAWNESDYLPASEVTTEISSRSGDLKISYVDHSKTYVAPVKQGSQVRFQLIKIYSYEIG